MYKKMRTGRHTDTWLAKAAVNSSPRCARNLPSSELNSRLHKQNISRVRLRPFVLSQLSFTFLQRNLSFYMTDVTSAEETAGQTTKGIKKS